MFRYEIYIPNIFHVITPVPPRAHSRWRDINHLCMMTSSNGNIFRVTGLCAGNSPVPVNSPHKGQWRGALMFSLICALINDWVNNREAGDFRRYRGHYDVRVMESLKYHIWSSHVIGVLFSTPHHATIDLTNWSNSNETQHGASVTLTMLDCNSVMAERMAR